MSTETTGKKRGRKLGTKSPRNILVTCISFKDKLVEEVPVDGDKSSDNKALMALATAAFEKTHGKSPDKVLSPHFSRQGQQTYQKKRDSIRIDVNELVFMKDKAVAEYNGWEVAVHYIENHPEAAYIICKRQLSPDADGKKKAKPQPKTVAISALSNVRPVEVVATA